MVATGWLAGGGEVGLGAVAGASRPMVGTTGMVMPEVRGMASAWRTLVLRVGKRRGGETPGQGMAPVWWRTSWGVK